MTRAGRVQVLVVGAGMSGLSTAEALERDDRLDVRVVDAGAHEDVGPLGPGDAGEPRWRPWTAANPPHYDAGSGLKRRVGGRSLCWHGIALRMEERCLAHPSWPDPMVSTYSHWERRLAAWCGRAGLATSPVPLDEQSLARLSGRIGEPLEATPRAVRPDAVRGGELQFVPWSPLRDGYRPDVVTGCVATRVCLGPDGRTTGMEVRRTASGLVERIDADVVVLAASTLMNGALVLRSLELTGPLFGLRDHLVQGALVRVPISAWRALAVDLEPGSLFHFGDEQSRSNYFVAVYRREPDAVTLDVWATGEQVDDRSAVMVSGNEHRLVVDGRLGARDWTVLGDQRRRLRQVVTDLAGGAELVDGSFDLETEQRVLDAPFAIAEAALGPTTPLAWYGCALGANDHESCLLPLAGDLVDEFGEIRAAPGLYVAGPAVFPRQGAANPSLTILALSTWISAAISRAVGSSGTEGQAVT